MTEADMDKATYTIQQPLPVVVERLQNAERNCGGLIAGYATTWYPAATGKTYKIDMFLRGIAGSPQSWVAGQIDLIKLNDTATRMDVAIVKKYSRPLFKRAKWWEQRAVKLTQDLDTGATHRCE
jgi:hypothetical protein